MSNIVEQYSSDPIRFENIKIGDEFRVIGHRFESYQEKFPVGSTVTAYEDCGKCICLKYTDNRVCDLAAKKGYSSCPTRDHRVHVHNETSGHGVAICALLLVDKKGRQVT